MESLIEFGLRDWLLILGSVFIVAVLLHGYWRMRSNRSTLKMALDKSFLNSRHEPKLDADELAPYRGELPNGGARVLIKPTQANLDLVEAVPVLMESVDLSVSQDALPEDQAESVRVFETSLGESNLSESGGLETAVFETEVPNSPASPRAGVDCPEKFVVLYVSARHKDFSGNALLTCLRQQNMTFGEMDIYHRLAPDGRSLFSLVNAVEPGAFDPSTMHAFKTPAVSLFMRAHELTDPVGVYHEMLGLAEYLATQLDGEIKNESRAPLTRSTMMRDQQELQAFVDTYFH
ncbi:cell division protein ZipA [Pseudomonadales bacterium]|nr:cell division protein ZipA [Pseudomonadales bacterium]MDB4069346.1 cell division protein ZipA [Pseudomonadales bacterium]